MKDLKPLLKQAREAIKNNDYNSSLRLSKSILREDKSNYMGLIFLGLSLQEKGPKEQAPKAFKKAIEQNSENPLGWNGLISCYEKTEAKDDDMKRELVKCYASVMKIETTEKKIQEYSEKLLSLYQYGNVTELCKLIYKTAKRDTLLEECTINLIKIVTDFLEKCSEMNDETLELYEKCLFELIHNANSVNPKHFSDYLTVLNKLQKFEEIIMTAEKMYDMFPTDLLSLSWICKVFNQWYVEENAIVGKYFDKAHKYHQKILEIENTNGTALFTKSIFIMKDNKVLEAKNTLIGVTRQRSGLLHAWVLLTDIYIRINLFEEASYTIQKSNKLLQSVNYSNIVLKNKVDILKMELLSKTNDKENWSQALTLYRKLQENNTKKKCIGFVIRANINLEKYAEAKLLISELKSDSKDRAQFLTAYMMRKQKNYNECLNLLQENIIDSADWWLEIGLTYWDLNQYDKCLMPFLKATKCDPNNYICFFHLGNYYRNMCDYEKARRCYERAFYINQKSVQVGTELSKIYRNLKNWEANLNLLHRLTVGTINKSNLSLFLQLGLHYLEQEDYGKAVENLRFVLRIDTDNVNCWESLGDAYYARGAYTSALKCYQKTLELSENPLYPSLQVANIKKILGEFTEAKSAFEDILFKNGQYVPALKSLAETSLCLARGCYKDQRLGTARDNAQYALEKLTIAVQQRNDLSCLWKLLADCSLFVTKLPEKYCCLFVSKMFSDRDVNSDNDLLEKEEVFAFATKCYWKAISLVENSILLWRDLVSCYLAHAINTTESEKQDMLFNYALTAAQHCTSEDPYSWQNWNLLGNVAILKVCPDYALAQHAYIKAVTVDHKSAISWCNLGILYLLMDDISLANEAFAQGQRSDPNYVNSWIGQALIAEKIGHEEAMDLFRHSTQIGQHQQGSIGYAHWVCQALLAAPPGTEIYAIHEMHAVPVACDAITWYIEKNPYDPCAWNILGLLKERLGLIQGAHEAFRNAYRLSEKQFRDKVKINYGRLLVRTNRYTEAIEIFSTIDEASIKSGSGLALTLFKDNRYEESYSAYEQALHWLTEKETYQSDLLVALASMAYMFQGPDAAKTLLFQSIGLKPASPWSLYATLSLGLLHKDLKLAKLVINELESVKDRSDCIPHYAAMVSYVYLLKGEDNKAIKEVSKLVHRHPQEAATWLNLSLVLLRQRKAICGKPGAQCALTAMALGRTKMDVKKVLCLVSQASLKAGNQKQALVFAQKALHCFPNIAEGWSVLSSVLIQKKSVSNCHMKRLLQHVEVVSSDVKLTKWSVKVQQTLSVK